MDPFRPRLIVPWKLFQVVFVHLVYNSALFLAPCCAFVLHVVASWICIFLDSRHLVLIHLFQNMYIPFLVKKCVPAVLLGNLISTDRNSFFFKSFFVRVQITLAYKRMWKAGAFCTDILENFWSKVGLNALFRIPSIWANFASFCWISRALMCRSLISPF
jgi:hypothetical protein